MNSSPVRAELRRELIQAVYTAVVATLREMAASQREEVLPRTERKKSAARIATW